MKGKGDFWNFGERYTYKDWKRTRTIAGITFRLPRKPSEDEVDGYGLAAKAQKFTPPDKDVVEQINLKYQNGEEFTDLEKEFIAEEWKRRSLGYWFYNNGYMEYVTGLHYFYLSAWKIPVAPTKAEKKAGMKKKRMSLPLFSDKDRDVFYHWEYGVERNDNVVGKVEVTKRRDGKTHRGNVTNYNTATLNPDVVTGMQSKTGTDVKAVFRKLVNSWKVLPEYYKPVDVGESDPKGQLAFTEPAKKDTKSQFKDYSKVLNSYITHGPSGETTYDGSDLAFYFGDEVGKTKDKEANVYVRWNVVKETMADGANWTGKALLTSTVETMEKDGGANLKLVWEESDPYDIDELKQTRSGLVRIFIPAYYGYRGEDGDKDFTDEYGYSNIKGAREYLEKKRKRKKGIALSGEIRKYPFTPEEAFRADNKNQILPDWKIYEQKDYNDSLGISKVVQGNFIWKDDIEGSQVVWIPNPDGRWMVYDMPDPKLRNNKIFDSKKGWMPGNMELYCSGCDPYDHKLDREGKKSDASSHTMKKFNILNPYGSNCFSSEYIFRQLEPYLFYADILKQCIFYGCQILVENNKPGIINYFTDKGYREYLMVRPEGLKTKSSKNERIEIGIPLSSPEVRQSVIEHLESYIYHNVGIKEQEGMEDIRGNMYFDRTMEDWLLFDFDDWTPHDATVSSALTVVASKKVHRKKKRRVEIGNISNAIQQGY